ncbi:hypothetical protein ElyMa_001842500 [Elysia marginata]|uniref:Uncharacterized protein n=1 Tax=Elysia marginata TaxID=1093978 RepID=A0AAV4EL22_9GAST|nr:hypothetical protein ElyMa_001842500 [Elysia marginata]
MSQSILCTQVSSPVTIRCTKASPRSTLVLRVKSSSVEALNTCTVSHYAYVKIGKADRGNTKSIRSGADIDDHGSGISKPLCLQSVGMCPA